MTLQPYKGLDAMIAATSPRFQVQRFERNPEPYTVDIKMFFTKQEAMVHVGLALADSTTTGVALKRWDSPHKEPVKLLWRDGPAAAPYVNIYARATVREEAAKARALANALADSESA